MGAVLFHLLVIIEAMAALGVIGALITQDTRVPFLVGFATLLPVTAAIAAHGTGAPWRRGMIVAFVLVYVVRMSWVLTSWYGDTAASKLKARMSAPALYGLPVVLANGFGWLYCFPFLWAVGRKGMFHAFDRVAVAVYVLGTIFHFASDYQKHRFKCHPDSRGRLLDTGRWGMCRHPNYFGDFLVYLSFALASASPWGFLSPVANLVQYLADAIPKSEEMSRKGYGDAWDDYCRRVRCFIPYVL